MSKAAYLRPNDRPHDVTVYDLIRPQEVVKAVDLNGLVTMLRLPPMIAQNAVRPIPGKSDKKYLVFAPQQTQRRAVGS